MFPWSCKDSSHSRYEKRAGREVAVGSHDRCWCVDLSPALPMPPQGGTSAAAPAAAGIFSLLNDARLRKGLPSLGFINPRYVCVVAHVAPLSFHLNVLHVCVCVSPLFRLYKVAAEFPGEVFYQMASGNSACTSGGSCCPQSTSFQAAADWDPITGAMTMPYNTSAFYSLAHTIFVCPSGLGSPLFEGLLKHLGSD